MAHFRLRATILAGCSLQRSTDLHHLVQRYVLSSQALVLLSALEGLRTPCSWDSRADCQIVLRRCSSICWVQIQRMTSWSSTRQMTPSTLGLGSLAAETTSVYPLVRDPLVPFPALSQ